MFAERTNEHGLGLRSLSFLKNHSIIFMLIVKRFLTFGVMKIVINISVQQVRFAHIGSSCFITEVTKQNKKKNLRLFFLRYDEECKGQQKNHILELEKLTTVERRHQSTIGL